MYPHILTYNNCYNDTSHTQSWFYRFVNQKSLRYWTVCGQNITLLEYHEIVSVYQKHSAQHNVLDVRTQT